MRASLKARRKSRVRQAHTVARRVEATRNRSSSRNGTRGAQAQCQASSCCGKRSARRAILSARRTLDTRDGSIRARENLGVARWRDSAKLREVGRLPNETQQPTATSALYTLTDSDGDGELVGDDAAGGDSDT